MGFGRLSCWNSKLHDMKTEESVIDRKSIDLVTRIIRMVEHLPKDCPGEIMGQAIIRSAAAAGIHYSDAQKAKSGRQFIHDLRLMQSQLTQTDFWLKMIEGTNYFVAGKLDPLKETNAEIRKMVEKSLRTATENQKKLTEQRRLAKERKEELVPSEA